MALGGGLLGAASFLLTEMRHRAQGRLSKREARRQLEATEERHPEALKELDQREKDDLASVAAEYNQRGMLYSSSREYAEERVRRDIAAERAELERNYDLEVARLRDMIGEPVDDD